MSTDHSAGGFQEAQMQRQTEALERIADALEALLALLKSETGK